VEETLARLRSEAKDAYGNVDALVALGDCAWNAVGYEFELGQFFPILS
jgi:hypothetical protein